MRVYGRSIRRAALFALILLTTVAPAASAVVVHTREGRFFGLMPHRGRSAAALRKSIQGSASTTTSSSGTLNYHGGAVLHSSAPYLIFWAPAGESIPAAYQTLLERYFTDAAADSGNASNVYAVGRQYTDGSGYADAGMTFSPSQVVVDTQPYPAQDAANCPDVTSGYPTCLTDVQLQQEVERVVAANGLPTDGSNTSKLPANAPIYFVVLPSDVNDCLPANSDGTFDCADNSFCAYHSSASDGSDNILYAAIPTVIFANGQDPKSCQADGTSAVQEPNSNPADVVLTYLSHEDNETITDPLGYGWWNSTSGNEDGDNCNITGAFNPANGTNPNAFLPTLGGSASPQLYDQVLGADDYYLQSEWSNGDGNCKMQPTAGTITPAFTAPTGANLAGSALSFNPAGSSSTYALVSGTWNWGDGTTTFKAGSSSLGTASHTYARGGSYTVTLTLVDNRGNAATSTQTVTVYPTAAFSYSPTNVLPGSAVTFEGSGTAGPGATITGYAWSFGDGTTGSGAEATHTYATAGTYTVQLTVTDSHNATSTVTEQLTAQPAANPTPPTPNPTSTPPSSTPPAPSPTPPPTAQPPGSDSGGTVAAPGRITKVEVIPSRRGATVRVTVSSAGTLTARRRVFHLGQAGTVRFVIRLTPAQLRTVRIKHRLKVRIGLRFAPVAGPVARRTAVIEFRPGRATTRR